MGLTNIWYKVFIEHCEKNLCGHGGTYWSHFWFNIKSAFVHLWNGFTTLVHAIFPILFKREIQEEPEKFKLHPDLDRLRALRDEDDK